MKALTTTPDIAAIQSGTLSGRWQGVGLMLAGAVIVYLVGFIGIPQVHNATHDTRHSTGFPCH